MRGLSPVAASGGHSSSRCAGLSLSWPLPLRSTGSRRAGSAIVAHGLSRSAACGIFPDQGSNPCALHWQADSQPLRHQGSPQIYIFKRQFKTQDIHSSSKLISQEKKDFRVFENESCLISLSWTTLRSQSQKRIHKINKLEDDKDTDPRPDLLPPD